MKSLFPERFGLVRTGLQIPLQMFIRTNLPCARCWNFSLNFSLKQNFFRFYVLWHEPADTDALNFVVSHVVTDCMDRVALWQYYFFFRLLLLCIYFKFKYSTDEAYISIYFIFIAYSARRLQDMIKKITILIFIWITSLWYNDTVV